ncbi:MAG: hypothetical protein QNJ36_22875 [Calothrix sp. MO_167.B42]|nr:hypothetical protein [Calothrix sp. MO_167.B42]
MIPLILGAIAIGAGVLGAGAAGAGIEDMNEAKKIGERAQKRHEDAVKELQQYSESTNQIAEEYDQFKLGVMKYTIGRFVDFIERNIGKAKQTEKEFLEELGSISIPQIQKYKADEIEAEVFLNGGIKAVYNGVRAGATASSTVTAIASQVGVASTGTAISGLSGAAATNATLAWLGGGSLASGGGGMALGSLVLGRVFKLVVS